MAGGLIGIEGPHLLEEAVRAGLRVRCIFRAAKTERDYFPASATRGECEILEVPRDILSAALETETPQPVAALIEPPAWTWADLVAQQKAGSLLVVLAGLQDPGNLGTILRSAEAFGADGVIMLPGTVSPWNQKAMRASAGSVFRMPIVEARVEDCFTRLHQAGIRVLTTAARGAVAADEMDFTMASAVLIGNEGKGVPAEIAARADATVTIPCPGPVESLNASVAAGILLYEASRQRRAAGRPGRSPS